MAAHGAAYGAERPGPGGAGEPVPPCATPFFRRSDWAAFWTVTLLAFALYFHTLAPTVTLEDSGELAVAADYLGVPHPPGYPIWTLTSWGFRWAFHWVRYYGQPDSNAMLVWRSLRGVFTPGVEGHPNPAWAVGLASAFFGALACGVLALLASRSSRDMLRGAGRWREERAGTLMSWAGAVSAGLLLACSPVLWSQSVIVEVYSLNAFFQLLVLLLLYRWMTCPKDTRILYAMAFLFGLGLTNHQTLLFLGLALAAAVLFVDLRLFRDFCLVGLALGGIVAFNLAAVRLGRPDLLWSLGPASASFWFQTFLFVAIPVAAMVLLPNGRVVGTAILLIELGVAFYLYLPFASEQNPPMNWGYPRTWEGFLHAVGRGQYERVAPADIFSERFLIQLGLFLTDLRGQFTLPITLAGFLPFCAWRARIRNRRVPALLVVLAMALASVPLIAVEGPLRAAGLPAPAFVARKGYMLLIAGVVLAGGFGVLVLAARILNRLSVRLREPGIDAGTRILSAGLAGLLAAAVGYADWMILRAAFRHPGMGSSLFGLAVVLGPILLAWLAWRLAVQSDRVAFELPAQGREWLASSGAAFFSVSFVFLAVLNNAPDVQTQFIGRVQFIQAHAVYALWIGYGLALAGAYVGAACGARRPLLLGLAGGFLALPGALLWQNAYDKEQIRLIGGAEQNRHDFGWQFGHWSMRGANAILEELPPEERAGYPNPGYPPEMEPGAIFFGGTDPGRFVPTYMIYSADVRPDIFLITQNALADVTYINVMRDLYGDRIWIPSSGDCRLAFDLYIQQVQAGMIPAGADVAVRDGRISVQGVQGVMHINGIMTRMIFDRNRFRHAFYVEESYPLPWMYPYLEPHGLILKLNAEPVELTPEILRNDREFWDWYTARLMGNPRFLRDIVARKTFSKLRCAIAGVYLQHQLFDEAEYAFRQAIELYPLSPEANFRLADAYMHQYRFEQARDLMSDFLLQDPHNERIHAILQAIERLIRADRRRQEIEALFPADDIDVRLILELAELYRVLQRWSAFDGISERLLSTPDLPAAVYLNVARLAVDVRRWHIVEQALRRALALPGAPPALWPDLLIVLLEQGKTEEMFEALDEGLAAYGDVLRQALRADPRFEPLRRHPEFQRRVPPEMHLPQPGLPDGFRRILR